MDKGRGYKLQVCNFRFGGIKQMELLALAESIVDV